MMGRAVGNHRPKSRVKKLQDENELLESASGEDTDAEMQKKKQAAQTKFTSVNYHSLTSNSFFSFPLSI